MLEQRWIKDLRDIPYPDGTVTCTPVTDKSDDEKPLGARAPRKVGPRVVWLGRADLVDPGAGQWTSPGIG